MVIGSGEYIYNWIENWVTVPPSKNGRTHGIVTTKDDNIVIFHQSNPAVLIYDKKGNLINSWGDNFSGAHGMTLVNEDGVEYLWLTDEFSGEVVKTTLDGKTVLNINKPPLEVYNVEKYSPTWVAVFEEDKGGNGDIWLADGYGASLVHHYNKEGKYISTITGEEGASRFNCPHSLFFDYRKAEPELYIADRGNKRFQVYDITGKFKRSFGKDILECPCGGAIKDDLLYIPELCARLAVLDKNDNLLFYLGQNEQTCSIPGWPDHPKELLEKGKYNSPHYLALDKRNNIFVAEWILGGRITKLEYIK